MKNPRGFIAGAVLIVLVAIISFQQVIISRMRKELAASHTALIQEESVATSPKEASNSKPAPPSGKKALEQIELLRLRKRSRANLTNKSGTFVTQNLAQESLMVLTNYIVSLKNEETTVAGGWNLTQGKKTFIFVTPEFDERREVKLNSRFVEIPENNAAALSRELACGRFFAIDLAAFFKRLDNIPGMNILTVPSVTTLHGQQVQISSRESTPTGKSMPHGPILDLVPVITPDSAAVSLTVEAIIPRSLALK
jgi:hypothetical protein